MNNYKKNDEQTHRKPFQRVFIIVTDSLGVGGDPESKKYDSAGANTFLHVSETGLLNIPTWKKLGIDSAAKLAGYNKAKKQTAYTARLQEISHAKDTLAGHWEMMGVETKIPFPTFTTTGFPADLIEKLEAAFGRKIVGNKSASGTEIINELADEEISHNKVIVYTSADSVLQICGHEKYMGLKKLYEFCLAARAICDSKPEWRVGRIIARPYLGEEGNFSRTANRHDYAVPPFHKTVLDELITKKVTTIGVGKIHDIFVGQGIDKSLKGENDDENMDIVIDLAMQNTTDVVVFANLSDFDSKYGHRRDTDGYAENINRFDIKLAKLLNAMKDNDLLIITSDHGTDPSMPGSDHTREQVPLTIYAKNWAKPTFLGTLHGFGTVGNIVARNFGVKITPLGADIFDQLV